MGVSVFVNGESVGKDFQLHGNEEVKIFPLMGEVNTIQEDWYSLITDLLLLAALSYQESGIDQSKKSHTGAIGAMQLLPSTAKDKNVNIPDIDKVESYIHAGTKYLHLPICIIPVFF